MPTEETPSHWDADARTYDAWFDHRWGVYASGVEHDLLIDSAPPLGGLDVCDAGCGTGRFAARLEAEGAHVTAVDADAAALAVARTRFLGDIAEADIEHLPFLDASFDITFAVTVCEFTRDPTAAVAEFVRITRPGGRVVLGSLNRHSPCGHWNRRQFGHPPWSAARFLDHDELDRIAHPHGTTGWHHGLYAPTALPGLHTWGPMLERLGRRLARRHAAFEVLTIDLQPSPPAPSGPLPPFLIADDHDEPSLFRVENLLREARRPTPSRRHTRTTGMPPRPRRRRRPTPPSARSRYPTPRLGVLPLRTLDHRQPGHADRHRPLRGRRPLRRPRRRRGRIGLHTLVSVSSAGVITPLGTPPYFVLIERAWRDEGTSHCYLPTSQWSTLPRHLDIALADTFDQLDEPVHRGTTWTTDAPLRETATAIERARASGIHAVEMEAAALDAYAHARHRDVVCIAHVTNTMATAGDDFEKGDADGTDRILRLVAAIAALLLPGPSGNVIATGGTL